MWGRVVATCVAVVLVCGGLVPRAVADAEIQTQWYYELTGIKRQRDAGLDGKGVKVALIDGKADLSMPELKGVDAKVRTFCSEPTIPEHDGHASNVLALMGNQNYGWAPKASYTVYASLAGKDKKRSDLPKECQPITPGWLVQEALNDQNDVIVITSVSKMTGGDYGFAVMRASQKGVPVVVGAGNDGLPNLDSEANANLVVSVGAGMESGTRWPQSNYGPNLTVSAAGADIATRLYNPDRTWGATDKASGTSLSAPQVGGLMALGRQKYPKVHGNQLIRTLIATTNNDQPGRAKTADFGYGPIAASRFLGKDPMAEPTTNPLMPGELPSQQWIDDYRDGLSERALMTNDREYVYRGNERTAAEQFPPNQRAMGTSPRFRGASPSATPSAALPNTGDPAPVTPWGLLVGLGAVVLVAAGAGVFFVLRRSGAPR